MCRFWFLPNETVIWCSLWFDWNELHCWSNNVYASIECWLYALVNSAKRLFWFLLSKEYNTYRQISRKTNSATQNVISMDKLLLWLYILSYVVFTSDSVTIFEVFSKRIYELLINSASYFGILSNENTLFSLIC